MVFKLSDLALFNHPPAPGEFEPVSHLSLPLGEG